MATRNQVLSLFGATPAQIQEQQRQKQAEMILSQRDPYAKTGAALGTALAGLFGGKTPEVERAEQLQQALGQVQFDNPESMYQGAEMLNTLGFPNEAVQLLGLAQDRAMNEQRIATAQAQETKAGFINAPRFVGYVEKPRPDGVGGFIMTQEPRYETTPIPVAEYEDYLNKEGKYANWYPSAEQASATDTNAPKTISEKGKLIGSRYVDGQRVDIYEKDGETMSYIGDEIYLPVEPESTQSNAPQQRKSRRSPVVSTPATSTVTSPAASNVRQGGQMRRNR